MIEALHAVIRQLGILGYPLLLCSCLIMAIIIERLIFYFLTQPVSKQVVDTLVKHKPISLTAETSASLEKNIFGNVILALIEQRQLPLREREGYCSLQLIDVERRLNRFLPILKILATISPLLGLLGTVLGMIDSFQMISTVDKPITPSLVSGGISQALLTTAVGLMLAILAVVALSMFQLRVGQLMHRLTQEVNRINLALQLESADETGADTAGGAGPGINSHSERG